MTREEIERLVEAHGLEDILLADGFDAAFIGFAEQFTRTIALYDRQKCIAILMERDGMTNDEAEEFFGYNVAGAWVGENTPAFATLVTSSDGETW